MWGIFMKCKSILNISKGIFLKVVLYRSGCTARIYFQRIKDLSSTSTSLVGSRALTMMVIFLNKPPTTQATKRENMQAAILFGLISYPDQDSLQICCMYLKLRIRIGNALMSNCKYFQMEALVACGYWVISHRNRNAMCL